MSAASRIPGQRRVGGTSPCRCSGGDKREREGSRISCDEAQEGEGWQTETRREPAKLGRSGRPRDDGCVTATSLRSRPEAESTVRPISSRTSHTRLEPPGPGLTQHNATSPVVAGMNLRKDQAQGSGFRVNDRQGGVRALCVLVGTRECRHHSDPAAMAVAMIRAVGGVATRKRGG